MRAATLILLLWLCLPCLCTSAGAARQASSRDGSNLHDSSSPSLRRCYRTKAGLSMEIAAEVKSVSRPVVAGDASSAERTLTSHGFPYSSSYCQNRGNKFFELRPDGCSLDLFEPKTFLKLIHGRRLVFWGDSVQRQFYTYISVRLQDFTNGSAPTATHAHYNEVGHGCVSQKYPFRSTGVYMNDECFTVKTDWSQHCQFYHGGKTSFCFVRADADVVDASNVALFNDLRHNDIVLVNTGLHHNYKFLLARHIERFASLLGEQIRRGRPMPLWLWRDTSAQHFRGGLAGNYPRDKELSDKLRHVKRTFRCKSYPIDEMRHFDWRNAVLDDQGVEAFRANKLSIPILRVWNTTAMLAASHPQMLTTSTIADCSHFCPTLGGVYEVWSTLFFNFLQSAMGYENDLKRTMSRSQRKLWRYPTKNVDIV